MFNKAPLKLFFQWVRHREQARMNKEQGALKPWTDDPVIQKYRFCNVRRMDDKVSKWLLDNWYDKTAPAHTNMIAAALARLINWPDSLAFVSGGKRFTHWDPKAVHERLAKWKFEGNKVFTGAYIINGARGGSKIKQVVENINFMVKSSEFYNVVDTSKYERTFDGLLGFPGLGSFMAGQIVADLRHVVKGAWIGKDTWAPIGPGSRRGMRRLLGKDPKGKMTQEEFNPLLRGLIEVFNHEELGIMRDRGLEAMDVQNCLCEFDKYSRVLNGEGRPKSLYDGITNQLI